MISKRIKYPGISLPKEAKKNYSPKTVTVMKETEDNTNGKLYHIIGLEASLISQQITNTREGVEKRELSFPIGGNISWYSHYGEQYGGTSEIYT